MLDKLGAFCLGEDEIAGRKFADVAILERTAEIFRTGFNPVFADLNLCVGNFLGFDIEDEMIWRYVIADETALVIRCSKQKIG